MTTQEQFMRFREQVLQHLTKEEYIKAIEAMPERYFGDLVMTNEISDGKSYRCAVDGYGEIYPGDLIPFDMLVGPDGIVAYKWRPEKKQEMLKILRGEE